MAVFRILRSSLWLVSALLFAGTIQDQPEVTTRQAPAVFKSSTNLVQVPVVVRDREGRAVGNLRAEDFRLSDNGRPQLISRFTIERMQTQESSATRAPGSAPGSAVSAALPNRFLVYLAMTSTWRPKTS